MNPSGQALRPPGRSLLLQPLQLSQPANASSQMRRMRSASLLSRDNFRTNSPVPICVTKDFELEDTEDIPLSKYVAATNAGLSLRPRQTVCTALAALRDASCRLLGSGGQGAVFLPLGSSTAVKVSQLPDEEDLAQAALEGSTVWRLSDPSIITPRRTYAVWASPVELVGSCHAKKFQGPAERCLLLVQEMAYVPGRTLTDHILGFDFSGASLSQRQDFALRALPLITRLVQHMHAKGLVHRDLKPDNIIVCRGTEAPGSLLQVKVLDLGFVGEHGREALTLGGTMEYFTLEALLNGCVHRARDWYAVGLILFCTLCGLNAHPYLDAATLRVLYKHDDLDGLTNLLRYAAWREKMRGTVVLWPWGVREQLHPALVALVESLLSLDADFRGGAAEVAACLDAMGLSSAQSSGSAISDSFEAGMEDVIREAGQAQRRGSSSTAVSLKFPLTYEDLWAMLPRSLQGGSSRGGSTFNSGCSTLASGPITPQLLASSAWGAPSGLEVCSKAGISGSSLPSTGSSNCRSSRRMSGISCISSDLPFIRVPSQDWDALDPLAQAAGDESWGRGSTSGGGADACCCRRTCQEATAPGCTSPRPSTDPSSSSSRGMQVLSDTSLLPPAAPGISSRCGGGECAADKSEAAVSPRPPIPQPQGSGTQPEAAATEQEAAVSPRPPTPQPQGSGTQPEAAATEQEAAVSPRPPTSQPQGSGTQPEAAATEQEAAVSPRPSTPQSQRPGAQPEARASKHGSLQDPPIVMDRLWFGCLPRGAASRPSRGEQQPPAGNRGGGGWGRGLMRYLMRTIKKY